MVKYIQKNTSPTEYMERRKASFGIFLKSDSVLMYRRESSEEFFPEYWSFPGGYLEDEESYEQALVREVKEETGMDVEKYKELHKTSLELGNIHFDIRYYVCDFKGKMRPEKGTELKFFKLDDTKGMNLIPVDKEALSLLLV